MLMQPLAVAFLVRMIGFAVAALLVKDLRAAVVFFWAFSFFSATYFAILGAPDVAFTEAAVGAAITTVFFVSAISWTGRE